MFEINSVGNIFTFRRIDKIEQTDDTNNSFLNLRVRVLSKSFTSTEFMCQRLDLIKNYKEHQISMNKYYTEKKKIQEPQQ